MFDVEKKMCLHNPLQLRRYFRGQLLCSLDRNLGKAFLGQDSCSMFLSVCDLNHLTSLCLILPWLMMKNGFSMRQFGGIKETIGRFYFAQTMKKKSNSCTFKIVITYAFWKSKCLRVPPSPMDLFCGSATMPSLLYPKRNPRGFYLTMT